MTGIILVQKPSHALHRVHNETWPITELLILPEADLCRGRPWKGRPCLLPNKSPPSLPRWLFTIYLPIFGFCHAVDKQKQRIGFIIVTREKIISYIFRLAAHSDMLQNTLPKTCLMRRGRNTRHSLHGPLLHSMLHICSSVAHEDFDLPAHSTGPGRLVHTHVQSMPWSSTFYLGTQSILD